MQHPRRCNGEGGFANTSHLHVITLHYMVLRGHRGYCSGESCLARQRLSILYDARCCCPMICVTSCAL
ncbi:hypothetical protein GDO81_022586 [Engystomops pustulosus]|uniref:Uncharacterized protein n=1 Tax=Engystomops pustulosus TaxID=76066 RepID=A0AAV6ZSV6_ENGPU|nr:hypothetical protein GDO81_022586 [Engystomops pustulosus]